MKVAPIIPNISPKKSVTKKSFAQQSVPSFKSDRYEGRSALDIAVSDLKKVVDEEINPFIDKYQDRYRTIGFMGLALQEVMQELKNQGNEYFQSELSVRDKYGIFEKAKSETDDYATYLMNIKEYEHLCEMAQNPFLNKPEIRKKAEQIKPLIYSGSEVFDGRKELLKAYKNAISTIDDTAGCMTIAQLPVYSKIQNLQNLYSSTIAAIMSIPVNDALHFRAEVKNLADSKENSFTKLDKAQRIAQRMYSDSLLKSIKNADKNEAQINEFIETNKDYKSKVPTVEEVKEAYKTLYRKRDGLLNATAQVLQKVYDKSLTVPYSNLKAKAVLDRQKAANEELWSMIQKAKEEYISQQNDEVIGRYK